MTVDASILRFLLLSLLLLACSAGAYAGADPTPTDWLPPFAKITLDGGDVVFDAKFAQIRLRNSQWEGTASLPIDMLKQKKNTFTPRVEGCSVPGDVLHRYENDYGHISVVSCELPERIWFASGGYCGEGEDDPRDNQGQLYSFEPASGKVQEYRSLLPKCAEVAGMARIGDKLVLATVYQGEYGVGAGNLLLFDLNDVKASPKDLTNSHRTGPVVVMSTYDRRCDCLWFATEQGIERLKLSDGRWEQRYLDYDITSANQFILTLSREKPSDQKMWLGRLLYTYPIEDLHGFVTAWNKSPATDYDSPRTGPLLLSFYFAAIERTKEGWSDWSFSGLMNIIAAYKDDESKVKIRAFLERMLKEPMNLSRRKAVVSKAVQFGVQNAKNQENSYFDDLLKHYFSGKDPDYSYDTDAVQIAFEHPEYLPKLRVYYLTHPLAFRVENSFIERVSQYSMWKDYGVIAAAIEDGRKRYDHRIDLINVCAHLESKPDENLLPILQARLETDAQAVLSMEKDHIVSRSSIGGNPLPDILARLEPITHTKASNFSSRETSCIDASYYWINFGGTAQLRRRIEFMVGLVEKNKELTPVVLDVLNYKFATRSQSVEGWKIWWSHFAIEGDCSKEMTACSGSPYGCASLRAPVNVASACNKDCQAHIGGRLNAAGVSVSYNEVTPVAPPIGCVGFRKDIGGTEAGAKCIARLLGYAYSPWGCNEDGFPYTVKIH